MTVGFNDMKPQSIHHLHRASWGRISVLSTTKRISGSTNQSSPPPPSRRLPPFMGAQCKLEVEEDVSKQLSYTSFWLVVQL
jgi:hypothetical protein